MPKKKFEIYDGTPAEVEKRLQGRQRTQIESVRFYNDENYSPNVVIIAMEEETGEYPLPMHYQVKEWTIQEWDNSSHGGNYYGNEIIKRGGPFHYLDAREGIKVLTLSQHFELPVYDDWSLPTLTITGNTNGGTAKVTNLGGWPEENLYFTLSNGDDPNRINWNGTKTELLAEVFDLSDETVFTNYISAGVSAGAVNTYWYSQGDGDYPLVLDSNELDVSIDYMRPEEEEGDNW